MPQWLLDLLKTTLNNPALRKLALEAIRTALNAFIDQLEKDPAAAQDFIDALTKTKQ